MMLQNFSVRRNLIDLSALLVVTITSPLCLGAAAAYSGASAPPAYNVPGYMDPKAGQAVLSRANGVAREEERIEVVKKLARDFELAPFYEEALWLLDSWQISFVVDDSASMKTKLKGQEDLTRWQEAKRRASMVMKVASVFDADGIDIYFLNNKKANRKNVCTEGDIDNAFDFEPHARTPLISTMDSVMANLNGENHLIVLVSDGDPTDDYQGVRGIAGLEDFVASRFVREVETTVPPKKRGRLRSLLRRGKPKFVKERGPVSNRALSILLTTDDDALAGRFDDIDALPGQIDVLDDYRSEKKQVDGMAKSRGETVVYSQGDHVARSLLGAIVPELDQMDGQ